MRTIKRNAGFTLIELMIVIAIIGILSVIALPAYRDYVARAQVAEIFSLMEGLKAAITETYNVSADFASVNSGVGPIPLANDVTGKWVDNIAVNNGIIDAQFSVEASSVLANGIVQISPVTHQGSMEWTCSDGTTIDERYLPRACRN